VYAVAFSPGGLLATAAADGDVRLWDASLFADPSKALCADVGPLSRQDWARYASGEPQPQICV